MSTVVSIAVDAGRRDDRGEKGICHDTVMGNGGQIMSRTISFLTMPWGKVRYDERGSGFPVLLLHGNGAVLESWALNIRELSSAFRVIALDIPGFGESEKPQDLSSIEVISDYILQTMKALSISKAHIVGNSLGGVIALDLARRHPESTEKLVLIATPSGEKGEMEKIHKLLSGWVRDDGIPRVTMEEGADITPKLDSRILALINNNLKMAGGSFELVNRALQKFDFKSPLAHVKSRAIILWGDQDRVAAINGAWILSHHLADAPVHIIKGAGHSPQFDQPRIVNRLILAFLKK
jgi:abhydrolase domain-containing protein 6